MITGRYLLERLLQLLVTLWAISLVVFVMLRLAPGDPASIMMGEQASPEQVDALRRDMGLDEPILVQYVRYMENLLHGDFGRSVRSHRPALEVVAERIPATLQLMASGFLLALVVGLPIGILSAVKHGSMIDALARLLALLAQAIPGFWLGLMMIIVFSVKFGWLPVAGRGSIAHLIMPTITLSFYFLGLIIRITRSELLDVLNQDYMRTARAKGLAERIVLIRHGLRNSMMPLITILGLELGTLLGGAVITETVFSWPGMGTLTVNSIYMHDYPIVQASVLLFGALFIVINAVVDILYFSIDPRLRTA
ncbi:MAG: ABC transporter permease [Thermomicrobiales bacterium]|nr:ABC transporter permease [Thermomicrobiales bacterium]MCO5220692.1 ABC transporter permease [Thermomicrobiales bacterium]